MWEAKYSIKTKSTKEQLWDVWTNVESWKEWDKSVEWSTLTGSFKVGSEGKLKPVGGPVTKFRLTKVEKFKSFSDQANLPLTKLQFIHEMSEDDNGYIQIVHRIRIIGLLTFLFSKVIGKNLKKELPKAMENLVRILEK